MKTLFPNVGEPFDEPRFSIVSYHLQVLGSVYNKFGSAIKMKYIEKIPNWLGTNLVQLAYM